ncbi:MAG: response regulator [Bacteroidetes bacterium]|nr:response regulator [Bacteroidota bacterium]
MTVRKKTILVVDDSPIILDRLSVKLRKLESAGSIHTANTYAGALEVLDKEPQIDIAVFDIHLEDKNGIDLLRVTRERYPHITVIMLTNQANEQVELRCRNLGASWFLDKSKDFTSIPQIISSIP